jgi:UDP-galactopyranose mutase
MIQADVVVVGAGISGATIAERFATELGKRVLILEKRDHIGGNCYDYQNDIGLLVSKYGAHIFHTSYEDVWEYVNRFSNWRPYTHRVLSYVDKKLVPVPVNITTVNELFGLHISSEKEMQKWLQSQIIPFADPKNSEGYFTAPADKALSKAVIAVATGSLSLVVVNSLFITARTGSTATLSVLKY